MTNNHADFQRGVLSGSVIYIVDDDAPVLESLEVVLTLAGAKVHTSLSARDFAEQLFDEPNAVLILDVHLHDGNGVELLAMLRAKGIRHPAIVMSGRLELVKTPPGDLLDPIIWLEKPIDGDELADLIAGMTSGRDLPLP
ncbi:response regulator [Hoeflea sp. AS60]|uniref:response regulator n=1 Tax=Hoeflea sp. AS60 TaxID=3135780 RepID=UPI003182482F